jgi:hypothetical protein
MNTHTKQFETTTQNGEEGIVHHKTHIYSNSKPLRSVILDFCTLSLFPSYGCTR